MDRHVKAHMALTGASIIYGVTYVAAKSAMPEYLSPFAFVYSRMLGATLLFWLSGLFIPPEKIRRKDYGRFLLAAFFGVALNQSLFLNGLSITSPIDSAIIMTSVPIMVMIVARVLVREPVTLFKVIGIFLGAAGALMLLLHSTNSTPGTGSAAGNLMIIGNATSYAIYLVIAKPLLERYHPVTVMKWIFVGGLVLAGGPGLPAFVTADWASLPGEIIYSVVFVIVGSTFLAYLLNNISLRHVKPVTVGIYIYSQPVIASVAAVIIGQDVITLVKVLSAILVFAGVYFVSYSSSRTGSLNADPGE